MNLPELRRECGPKTLLNLYMYVSTKAELERIARKENTKISWIVRHCINQFLREYHEQETLHPDKVIVNTLIEDEAVSEEIL